MVFFLLSLMDKIQSVTIRMETIEQSFLIHVCYTG